MPVASYADGGSSHVYTASIAPGTVTWQRNATVTLHVQILDNGTTLPPKTSVRASLDGDATFVTGLKTATAIAGDNGAVDFSLLPGRTSHVLTFRFDLRDGFAVATVEQRAAVRAPLVVGYATAGIGAIPGNIEAPDTAPNGTDTRKGAVSIYGTGEISRHTVGTFAYDSTDTLEQTIGSGPFMDNPNERPFPIYGDTSLRYDDALSLNRWYARIDNGDSSAQWGQFYAKSGPPVPIGGFSTLLSGASARFGGNVLSGTAFTAENRLEFARQLLSPTGLGIADQALHPDIVVGSDQFTLVHLDAHTGAVLSQTVLVNGSDYSIDYASGLVRFIALILPYDAQLNPQLVVAQYEYGGPGAATTLTGATGSWNLSRGTRFSSWYLNDATGVSNLDLFGQSFSVRKPWMTLAISHERSNGLLPELGEFASYGNGGDAYGVDFNAHTPRSSYVFQYQDTAAGYQNPYGPYASAGLRSLRGSVHWIVSRIASLEASATSATNALPGAISGQNVNNSASEASLSLDVKPNTRFSYHAGIRDVSGSSNGAQPQTLIATSPTLGAQGAMIVPPMFGLNVYEAGNGRALQADTGAAWKFTNRAALSLDRTSDLSSSIDPYAPPATTARMDLDVGANGDAFVSQSWFDQSPLPFAASQIGADYAATARTATSIGYQEKVGSTTLESGYSIEHTASGSDLFDAIGAQAPLAASKNFSVDAFTQVGQELFPSSQLALTGPAAPFFLVGGTSMNYQHETFKASGSFSVRTGYAGGSTLSLGAAGPISPAVSLYGSYMGDFTSLVDNAELRAGASYRPSRNDRYVTLFSIDNYRSNLIQYDAYVTNVAQIQELYRSSTRTEFAGSYAYKLTGDAYFAPHTSIYGIRGDQRIGSRLDIGSEYHWSDIAPIAGASATGFATELGYRVGATLRVAAGYNFSGFADPAAAVNPTHRGLYATLSTYVDRIFGWGEIH